MAKALAQAFVQVRPDAQGFGPELKKEIDGASAGAGASGDKAGRSFSSRFSTAARKDLSKGVEGQLAQIASKASALSDVHPELKIKIDAAAASAKMAILRKDLKETAKDADDTGHRFRNAFLGLSGGSDAMKLFSADAGMAEKAMAGLSLATGLLEPLAAGLIVGVGGLGAAAITAGAGLGIFGEVAKGVFGQVSSNIKAVAAAQAKIADGDTGKKLIADNKAIAKALADLTPAQKNLTIATANAETQWHNFTRSATAGVSSVLVPALGLIPKALSLIKPFLAPVESALRGIVADVSHGLDSGGLKSFMADLSGHAGGDITKIGIAIGHIVTGLGGIVKAFIPVSTTVLGGLDKLTAGFAKWGSSLSGHSGFAALMSEAKQYAGPIAMSLKNIADAVVHLVSDMAGTKSLVPVWAAILPPLTKFLDKLITANPMLVQFGLYALAAGGSLSKIGKAISGVSAGITGIKSAAELFSKLGKSMGLVKDATEAETVAQGELDVAMDANPIGLIVIAVGALVVGIVELVKHSTGFRNFWKGAWKDAKAVIADVWNWIKGHWPLLLGILTGPIGLAAGEIIQHWHAVSDAARTAFRAVEHAVGDALSWIRDHWRVIAAVLAGPIGVAVLLISRHWNQIVAGARQMGGDVISFFRGLPGRILGALSSLPGELLSFGGHIVRMLADGILGAAGAVVGAITHVASEIWDHIPHSPARKGPLSGQGSPDISGRKTSLMFAQGILAGSPAVQAAAARMAGAGMPRLGTGTGGGLRLAAPASPAAATAGGVIQLEWVGGGSDSEVFTYLKKHIRVRGGDPAVLGR